MWERSKQTYSHELIAADAESPGRLRGVSCDVVNCAYHDGDSYCTASRITVGPTSAARASETACATFRKKQRRS